MLVTEHAAVRPRFFRFACLRGFFPPKKRMADVPSANYSGVLPSLRCPKNASRFHLLAFFDRCTQPPSASSAAGGADRGWPIAQGGLSQEASELPSLTPAQAPYRARRLFFERPPLAHSAAPPRMGVRSFGREGHRVHILGSVMIAKRSLKLGSPFGESCPGVCRD